MILLLSILVTLATTPVEDFPTFSITELAVMSGKVVHGKYLDTQNGQYRFKVKDLIQETGREDTILIPVKSMKELYYMADSMYGVNLINFTDADELIIYLETPEPVDPEAMSFSGFHYFTEEDSLGYFPAFSGFRLLKDGKIYLPVQPENPGKFTFWEVQDSLLNWPLLLERVKSSFQRISRVKNLKKIENPFARNEALFQWIEQSKDEFSIECGFNEDCGWGSLRWEVFEWIANSGIAKDTWHASELYRRVKYPWEDDTAADWKQLALNSVNPFRTYEDVQFLIDKSKGNASIGDRRQALRYLQTAARIVYENNYPIPDSATLAFQHAKQKEIRDLIFPLMTNDTLKDEAFRVVSAMSNPMDGILEHRIDLELKPALTNIYLGEPPSRFRDDLGYFLAHNSTEEEWKSISSNDKRILINLDNLWVNPEKTTLRMSVHYNYGREEILQVPEIKVESVETYKSFTLSMQKPFELPWRSWSSSRELVFDISSLPKGKYKVWAEGVAGAKSQYKWQSAVGYFEL